jgi:hypothetical protein
VDLGAVRDVGSIKLFNRKDCCAERLINAGSGFTLGVSDTACTGTDICGG